MALQKDGKQVVGVQGGVSGLLSSANATVGAGRELSSNANKVASTMNSSLSILDKLNSFSNTMLDIGTEQQKNNAREDAITDVMGGGFEPYEGDSPYGAVYNQVGSEAYLTKAKNELNDVSLANFEKYKQDPEKFLTENSKAVTNIISNAPSKALEFTLTESSKNTQSTFLKNIKDNRHTMGIKKEVIGLKDNIAINTGILVSQMGKGIDPTKTIETLRKSYGGLVEQGLISEAGVQQEIVNIVKKGQREAVLNNASAMGVSQAKNYLKNLKLDDEFTADEKVEIKNRIKGEINSRELKVANNNTKLVKINDETIKGMIDVLEDGFAPSEQLDPKMLISPAIAIKYKTASDNYNSLVNMSKMTVGKQVEYINNIDRTTPAGAKKYKYLSKQHKRFANDNLIETSQSFGMMDNDFIDVNSSGDMFKKREGYQNALTAKYGRQSEFFTDTESDQLRSWYGTANSEDKIQFLNKIKDLDNSQKILSEVSKKTSGNLAFTGELIKTKNVSVAKDVLEGETLEITPPSGLKVNAENILGSIISRGSAEDFNTYAGAAVNYSKAKLAQGSTIDAKTAIEATNGKIAEYNGKKIFLPMNTSKETFNTFLKNWKNPNAGLQKDINELDDFFDGDIQLHYTGRGKYQIYYPDVGRYAAEKNADGVLAPVEIDYGSK